MIKLHYSAIDGFRKVYTFSTIEKAQAVAWNMVGRYHEHHCSYAVSDDGVGKIIPEGCTIAELFPDDTAPSQRSRCGCEVSNVYGGDCIHTLESEREAEEIAEAQRIAKLGDPIREEGCTCSDSQLNNVGCDCRIPYPE
jgi:hypothetical protein